jgi:hypothetical protein
MPRIVIGKNKAVGKASELKASACTAAKQAGSRTSWITRNGALVRAGDDIQLPDGNWNVIERTANEDLKPFM